MIDADTIRNKNKNGGPRPINGFSSMNGKLSILVPDQTISISSIAILADEET